MWCNIVVQYIWDNMGYSISQEKILTKSKKNNNLTKLHTSHAASTTPTAAPTRITVGAFLFVTLVHYPSILNRTEKRTGHASRPAVIKDSGSLPVHRAEITLRGGLLTEQKSRFAARGAEILKKGFTDVLK
jgi:hypothetical protein